MAYTVDLEKGPSAMREAAFAIAAMIPDLSEKWDSNSGVVLCYIDPQERSWVMEAIGDKTLKVTCLAGGGGKSPFNIILQLEEDTRRDAMDALFAYGAELTVFNYLLDLISKKIVKEGEFNKTLNYGDGYWTYMTHGDEVVHIANFHPSKQERFGCAIRYSVLDI